MLLTIFRAFLATCSQRLGRWPLAPLFARHQYSALLSIIMPISSCLSIFRLGDDAGAGSGPDALCYNCYSICDLFARHCWFARHCCFVACVVFSIDQARRVPRPISRRPKRLAFRPHSKAMHGMFGRNLDAHCCILLFVCVKAVLDMLLPRHQISFAWAQYWQFPTVIVQDFFTTAVSSCCCGSVVFWVKSGIPFAQRMVHVAVMCCALAAVCCAYVGLQIEGRMLMVLPAVPINLTFAMLWLGNIDKRHFDSAFSWMLLSILGVDIGVVLYKVLFVSAPIGNSLLGQSLWLWPILACIVCGVMLTGPVPLLSQLRLSQMPAVLFGVVCDGLCGTLLCCAYFAVVGSITTAQIAALVLFWLCFPISAFGLQRQLPEPATQIGDGLAACVITSLFNTSFTCFLRVSRLPCPLHCCFT